MNHDRTTFITCRKIMIVVLALGVFMDIVDLAPAQMLNDYPLLPEPELEVQPAGRFVKKTCTLDPHSHCQNGQSRTKFKWHFKACGNDLHKPKCHNIGTTHWDHVPDKHIKSKPCNSTLILQNTTSNNSGLYRCLVAVPGTDMRLVKTYELQIIDRLVNKGVQPELLDIQPINTSFMQDVKIAIQCRVYSNTFLNIFWLKQSDSTLVNGSFEYNNVSYVMLNSSQIGLDNNVYVSKLIIEKSSERDSGVYKCLAMNGVGGTVYQDVYIYVTSSVAKYGYGNTSFPMLFLIPLGLALVPITAWLCYYRNKMYMSTYHPVHNHTIPNNATHTHRIV